MLAAAPTRSTCRAIAALRGNVSEAGALRAFRNFGIEGIYWRALRGPLQRLALVHVPFSIYMVQYHSGNGRKGKTLGVETAEGLLDLMEFDAAAVSRQFEPIETRNCLEPMLGEAQAAELLRERALRLGMQQKLLSGGRPRMEIARLHEAVYMPYWLGFYDSSAKVKIRVLDAVRGRIEGGKATALFENWLTT